jgi:periplasmic glucans biosynthesis protein
MPTVLVVSLLLAGMLLGQGAPSAAAADADTPFTFDTVVAQARDLATSAYAPPAIELPDQLGAADYDAYRKIRFRSDQALWRGASRFEVQFFHLGFLFRVPVEIHVVENGAAVPVAFESTMFDYGDTGLDSVDALPPGFAGFRVHYPLHDPGYKDEVIVFLGASYFRVLGREQRFGLSARGLAINTALPRGEEFPVFRAFWLVKPAPDDTRLTLYALLDGPSLTGAYRFVVEPGTDSRVDVSGHLFARDDVEKIGIAPLTSMHLFGENSAHHFDDFRPEVHDSDGLLMLSGAGQWLWRPLTNPPRLQVSHFVDAAPRGFGLFQRDRRFANYQDTEANYDRRPSYWIEPDGDWGEGGIELVEIPSAEEIHDNIVAYWRPKSPLRAGESLSFTYTLSSGLRLPRDATLGRAIDTRTGSARLPGTDEQPSPGRRRFVVDFAEGDLGFLGASQPVQADLSASAGMVSDLTVMHVADSNVWRVAFRLDLDDADAAELALTLRLDGAPLTETWLYRASP